jgi:hypothetical protein
MIVFVYTLFGVIQFRVRFIKAARLVGWLAKLIIVHNWYLSVKFGLISLALYFFNRRLEQQVIQMSEMNCSINNYREVLLQHLWVNATRAINENSSELTTTITETELATYLSHHSNNNATTTNGTALLASAIVEKQFAKSYHYVILSELIDTFAGPFKVLDNRATLLYGLDAIAIYIMLAIFPFELMVFVNVGFNFIRFVLNDPNCMRDFYVRRRKHLLRLTAWSRNQTDCVLTRGGKMLLSQRDLRSNYAREYNHLRHRLNWTPEASLNVTRQALNDKFHLELFPETLIDENDDDDDDDGAVDADDIDADVDVQPIACSIDLESGTVTTTFKKQRPSRETKRHRLCIWKLPSIGRGFLRRGAAVGAAEMSTTNWLQASGGLLAPPPTPVAQFVGHPDRQVKQLKARLAVNHHDRPTYQVCVANRNLLKFKPFVRSHVWFKASMIVYIISVLYTFTLISLLLGLVVYFSVMSLWNTLRVCSEQQYYKTDGDRFYHASFNHNDQLDSSWSTFDRLTFYETFYIVFLLGGAASFYCSYYICTVIELAIWMRELNQQLDLSIRVIDLKNSLSHSYHLDPIRMRRYLAGLKPSENDPISDYVNEFGGMNKLFPWLSGIKRKFANWRSGNFNNNNRVKWSTKNELRELMAIRLLARKETLFRATYVNMCLFFDELQDTRYMTEVILRRTTQICAGFAFMITMTKSQLKLTAAVYTQLNFLLIGILAVLNAYLYGGALVNSGINQMLAKIHSLIGTSIRAGSDDADLFDFWLRQIVKLGEEQHAFAYEIYGHKITYSNIMKLNNFISSAYFFTSR